MAKYTMLNCWDDNNKGDLGIMLATVNAIRSIDAKAEIIGVSSFDNDDPMFKNNHNILKQYLSEVCPAIYGAIGVKFRKVFHKSLPFKIVAMSLWTIRHSLLMSMPRRFARVCLTNAEQETLAKISDSNVFFSKGGTVFTDYNSLRGAFALIRICGFFELLRKFNFPYFILGQSFGPISNKFALFYTNKVLRHAEKVYIRENDCQLKYPEIELHGNNVVYSGDAGFLLQPRVKIQPVLDTDKVNVGFTLRHAEKGRESYANVMADFITWLVRERGACPHIFNQVSMSSEPDIDTVQIVLDMLPHEIRSHVIYHEEDLLPQELCWYYGQMRALIGTRLHSTIFAMKAGTPVIGIVYQGTKMQGIFEKVGVSELVIEEELSLNKMIEKYNYIENNYDKLKNQIRGGVAEEEAYMMKAVRQIVMFALNH